MFWYHDDLDRLEAKVTHLGYDPKLIFLGSSTFTLWEELETIFKEYKPVNLGFGGSTLAACTWFFDRIFKNIHHPESIVIYAGDNDLGDGRHPEEVVLFFDSLLSKIRNKYGAIPVAFISIKPSITRWSLAGSIRYTNSNIKDYMLKDKNFFYLDIYSGMLSKNGHPKGEFFIEDGLHFSEKGYLYLKKKILETDVIFPRESLVKM